MKSASRLRRWPVPSSRSEILTNAGLLVVFAIVVAALAVRALAGAVGVGALSAAAASA